MVRAFGLRDILALRQLQARGTAFDLRRVLLHGANPLGAALLGYLTHQHWGAITCVREDAHGRAMGFGQVSWRASRSEWDLTYLAPSLDDAKDSTRIWQDMLAYLIISGAQQGVRRIYARSAEDAEAESVLRSAGFTVVTREELFVLARPAPPAPRPRGLRRVEPGDQWRLERFFQKVMPPLVQKAEGPAPVWRAAQIQQALLHRPSEFIWADRGEILAYLALTERSHGFWLDVVVQPEQRAEVLPYIKHVLSLADCSNCRPTYCPVADYGVGVGWLLRTLGFESYTRQVIFVAHTVARVPVRRPLVIPGLEGGIESVHH